MHEEIFNRKTRVIFSKIANTGIREDFYLAGGTGLALQVGHRKSYDLDWFSEKDFSTKKLKDTLSKIGEIEVIGEDRDILNCIIEGVKLSFFKYPFKKIFTFVEYQNGIKIADKRDIACMKVSVISARGSKKDFIDLFFLLKEFSLESILSWHRKKYINTKYSDAHLSKSLTYFKDADKDSMPIMLRLVKWADVKKDLIEKVRKEIK